MYLDDAVAVVVLVQLLVDLRVGGDADVVLVANALCYCLLSEFFHLHIEKFPRPIYICASLHRLHPYLKLENHFTSWAVLFLLK